MKGLGTIFTIEKTYRNPNRDVYTLHLKHPVPAARNDFLDKAGAYYELFVDGAYIDRCGIHRGRLDTGVRVFVDFARQLYLIDAANIQRFESFFARVSKATKEKKSDRLKTFRPEACTIEDAVDFFNAIVTVSPGQFDRETLEKIRSLKRHPDFGHFFNSIPRELFQKAFAALDLADIEDARLDPRTARPEELKTGYGFFVKMIAGRLLERFEKEKAFEIYHDKVYPVALRVNDMLRRARKLSPTRRLRLQRSISHHYPRIERICSNFVFKNV